MKIAVISSKKLGNVSEGVLKNDYLYNDKELFDDGDLNWYDYGFRNYDAQIGKFVQMDPLADGNSDFSPYAYAANDPIGNIDFMGLDPVTSTLSTTAATAITLSTVTITAVKATSSALSTVSLVSKFISSTGITLRVAATASNLINSKIGTSGVGPDNEYKAYRKNGEVVSYEQTGTKGGDIIDEITYVNLDRIPNADGIEKESVWVKKSYGYSPNPSGIIRSPGSLHINTKMLQSGSVNPIDLTDFIPTKAGLKFAGAVFLAGLKKGAAKGGSNIALGVSEHLDDFARSVNGSTWKTWGAKDFQSQFIETINNSANKIHFNLDGVASPWGAVSEGAKGFGVSRATSWELYQLYSNPAALQRTIFYQGGKVVPNPFH